MNLQPQLQGSLLYLKPLLRSEFEILYKAASDPAIWEQHPDRLRYQREIFQKFFDSGVASGGAFIIYDARNNGAIGSSRFYDYFPEKNEIKVGYTFLAKKYWGGEFNYELKKLMLTYAFQYVDTVFFEVGPSNRRSQKALEKIGASFVREIQKPRPDGSFSPTLVYVLEKKNFSL